MSVHSFHLVTLRPWTAAAAMVRAPRAEGLVHLEVLAGMELGSAVFSLKRMQLGRLAVFAEWENQEALDSFLDTHPWGIRLARGWHVRLHFLRRWGCVREQGHLPQATERTDPQEPIVAVTLARMRLLQLPRFLRWGRPVERQVRHHPETTLALAAMRPPHTVSTFSIWDNARAMTDMVAGRSPGHADAGDPHRVAMAERKRRDFHHEFTTLRFRPLSEHGSWDGRGDYVPWVR